MSVTSLYICSSSGSTSYINGCNSATPSAIICTLSAYTSNVIISFACPKDCQTVSRIWCHYQAVAKTTGLRYISKEILAKRGLLSCLDYYLNWTAVWRTACTVVWKGYWLSPIRLEMMVIEPMSESISDRISPSAASVLKVRLRRCPEAGFFVGYPVSPSCCQTFTWSFPACLFNILIYYFSVHHSHDNFHIVNIMRIDFK